MAGSGMIVGGLLKGLGSGLSMEAQQRRDNALIALRRQYQLEDETSAEDRTIRAEDRAETRTIAGEKRAGELKVGLLALAQQFKREEWETEQQYEERLLGIKADLESRHIIERGTVDREKATHEETLNRETERLKSRLRTSEDAASQKLADQLDDADRKGEIYKTEVNPDGLIVVTFKSGRIVTTRTKGQPSSSSSDDAGGGTIAAAQARRGGGTPAPSPTPTPSATSRVDAAERQERELNRLTETGAVPKGVEGQWITGPNGERAQWVGGKWVIFKASTPVPDRGR